MRLAPCVNPTFRNGSAWIFRAFGCTTLDANEQTFTSKAFYKKGQ
jgi:hypothetical protein